MSQHGQHETGFFGHVIPVNIVAGEHQDIRLVSKCSPAYFKADLLRRWNMSCCDCRTRMLYADGLSWSCNIDVTR